MKAVVMQKAGGCEVLSFIEMDEPQISSDKQIKVQLRAAGVNPIDTKIRSLALFYPDLLPAVLGCDGAGDVVEVGDAVSRFKVGDAVWFCNGGLGREQGNYAEYVVLDEAVAQPKPTSLDYPSAAAAPLALITAWEALFDRGRLVANKRVLIHAGAGGVGHLAIQLAKQARAVVYTTVNSAEQASFVKVLGADEVFINGECDFVDATLQLTDGRGVDLALEMVGPELFRQTIPAVAHYGDLVTLLTPPDDMAWGEARSRNLRFSLTLMLTPMLQELPEARLHHGEILQQCAKLFDRGELNIAISKRLPLEQAAEAHRLIELGHTRGKIVLIP